MSPQLFQRYMNDCLATEGQAIVALSAAGRYLLAGFTPVQAARDVIWWRSKTAIPEVPPCSP